MAFWSFIDKESETMRMRERERDHKIDSVGAIIAMKENEDVIVQRERETENARRSNNRETDVNKEWKREGEIETERKIEREDVRVDRGRKK